MKTLQKTVLLLLFTLAATGAVAQVRGEGRVSGKVVDDAGQPLQDVQVKATMTGQTQPVQAKSNKKGEWAVSGIAGGEWNIEFTKEGFDPQAGKVNVDESAPPADVTVKLAKHVDRVDPAVELNDKAQEGMELLQAAEIRRSPQDLRGPAREVSRRPPAQRLHRPDLRRREQHRQGGRAHADRVRQGPDERGDASSCSPT